MYSSVEQSKVVSVGIMLLASGLTVTAVLLQFDKIVGRKLQRNRTRSMLSEGKFPWEPSDSTVERCMVDVLKAKRSKKISADEQHRQLSFLASMTFSNGGVRLPSCPCCQ
jgi:hypothetical protein